MELTVLHRAGCVLASTQGPIDASAESVFREQLFPLVGQSGTKVVLDLSGSKMLNSQGISQLVALVAHANTHASRVVLAACTSFVSIVLSRCKLDRFFDIAPSVEEAVRLLSEG
jgi:anti-anti-sigma factor